MDTTRARRGVYKIPKMITLSEQAARSPKRIPTPVHYTPAFNPIQPKPERLSLRKLGTRSNKQHTKKPSNQLNSTHLRPDQPENHLTPPLLSATKPGFLSPDLIVLLTIPIQNNRDAQARYAMKAIPPASHSLV